MNDDLLMAMAREEGWQPTTAIAAADAAAWLNSKGCHVYQVA